MEWYPRKIEEKLDRWMKRGEVILIKGPRQAGKTTLLLHLKEKYGGTYLTLEDEEVLNSLENNPKLFIERFLENEKKTYLFLDEAQYSKKIGKILKLLYDLHKERLKLVVTGSGSFDIKVEVGKYLVGRSCYFELYPLDFEEFLMWRAKDLHKIFREYRKAFIDFISGETEKIDVTPVFHNEFIELLNEYVVYGGYPAVVKEEEQTIKSEILHNLLITYLEKDVFFFFNVFHLEKFKTLMKYLAASIAELLEITTLSKDLHIDYRTAEKYLSILNHTYVIELLNPFRRSMKTELRKSKKLYFIDLGLRNALLNNFHGMDVRDDIGKLLENFIHNELRRGLEAETKYWRTTGKAEVDFIITMNGMIVPCEVKTRTTSVGRSFTSFIKTYRPERGVIFTDKEFTTKTIHGTKVAFVPHYFI